MKQLRFYTQQVVWQEVPNETSLAFLISGCPLGCKGCHSAKQLKKYRHLITCVLFMGGEWHLEQLLARLKQVRKAGLKTCLYTGLEMHELDLRIISELTYLKTGRWIAELGGLNSPNTNQRFIDLRTQENLNHLFIRAD